jgi:U4/U6.U5 tri-snRNP-associated protein 3
MQRNDRDLDRNDPRDTARRSKKYTEVERKRSRSPRDERRDKKKQYRVRSPVRRDNKKGSSRDSRHKGDGPRGGDIPSGPRGAPSGPRGGSRSSGGNRADTNTDIATSVEESKDVAMEEAKPKREKPEGMDDETWEMMQVMGFGKFKTTKNTKVPGNDKNFAVRKEVKMEARQYMNRTGGFNRPLSPGRG